MKNLSNFKYLVLSILGLILITGCSQTEDPIATISAPADVANKPLLKTSLSDGLISYYPFNGNANDESGNGNNGIVYGALLTTDRFGNIDSAYDFDGVDDYISLGSPSILAISEAITISAWIKPIFNGTWGHPIIAKRSGPYERSYDLSIYNNGELVWGYANNGHQNIEVYDIINEDIWQHILCIYYWDGTQGQLIVYANGIKVGEENKIHQMLSNINMEIAIGTFGTQGEYYYNGPLDDIRIYNRALTEVEIQQLYNEGQFISVNIDIKPDSGSNNIEIENDEDDECEDDSRLRVAILSTSDFDALAVDASTVELGDPTLDGTSEPIRSKEKDVNRDGIRDLLLVFSICDLINSEALDLKSTELVLSGETFDGTPISGSDSVNIIQEEEDEDDDDNDENDD